MLSILFIDNYTQNSEPAYDDVNKKNVDNKNIKCCQQTQICGGTIPSSKVSGYVKTFIQEDNNCCLITSGSSDK